MDSQFIGNDILALVNEYKATGDPVIALRIQKMIPKLPPQEKSRLSEYLKRSKGANQRNYDVQAGISLAQPDWRNDILDDAKSINAANTNLNNQKENEGGGMADDNGVSVGGAVVNTSNVGSAIATEMEQKLAKIEERLKQISGYKFLPPSIQEEKESLERQKQVLLSTKSRAETDGEEGSGLKSSLTPNLDPPKADSSSFMGDKPADSTQTPTDDDRPFPVVSPAPLTPPSTNPTPSVQLLTPDKDDLAVDIKSEEPRSEENKAEEEQIGLLPKDSGDEDKSVEVEDKSQSSNGKSAKLVGNDYAFSHEEDERATKEKGRETESEEVDDQFKKSSKPKTVDDVAKAANAIIDVCREALAEEIDNPDKDYLVEVLDDFKQTISTLSEKARSMEMSESWKAKAVRGRLASYIRSIRADFEFSELLTNKVDSKMKELVD